MATAFTLEKWEQAGTHDAATRKRVLVTGAGGRIGSHFAADAYESYALRLMVQQNDSQTAELEQYGEVVVADLGDLPRMKEVCRDIDTVVHLAGDPSPNATWDELLPANIIGTYNTFVAAKAAGCRRVVYASSIHAVSGYPSGVQVKTDEPVNPGDLYGVSKCFGEALGRYMAEQEGISVIALRIGGYQPPEGIESEVGVQLLNAWVSHSDLHQLIRRCIDADGIRFALVHAVSNNLFNRLDISDTRMLLGYEPQDDAWTRVPGLGELDLSSRIAHYNRTDQESGLRTQLDY